MAEQGTLQQLGAEARATDRHERRLGTAAPAMNRPGQDPLARPALAPDEDHGVRRGHLTPLPQHDPQRRILAIERDFGNLGRNLLFQVIHAVLKAAEPQDTLQHRPHLRRRERLGQVVERTPPHRLDGVVDAAVRRDDDDGRPGCTLQAGLHQVETRVIAEPEIHQRDVESRSLDQSRRVDDPCGVFDRVAHRLEGESQCRPNIRLVINDEDSHRSVGSRQYAIGSEEGRLARPVPST